MDLSTLAAAISAGALIGLVLGLIGGGGSMLATPLLIYAVGVDDPHTAIGTGAVAVAANALIALAGHARAGPVKDRCALVFAVSGLGGALAGAQLALALDAQAVLAAFGLAMVAAAVATALRRADAPAADVRLTRTSAPTLLPRLVSAGAGAGAASGFFGIGGGFLITPGLVWATGMAMPAAAAASLIPVAAFALVTSASYAAGGHVAWPLAAALIAGGAAGAGVGGALARRLAVHKRALNLVFALMAGSAGLFICAKGAIALLG